MTHEERRLRREAMVQDFLAGMTVEEVMKSYGLCYSSVMFAAKVAGRLSRRSKSDYPTVRPRVMRVIAKLLQTPAAYSAIAAEEGVSREAVRLIAKDMEAAGVKFTARPHGGKR